MTTTSEKILSEMERMGRMKIKDLCAQMDWQYQKFRRRIKANDFSPEDLALITTDNAPELVQRAGVTVRAYAEVEQKFTDLLLAQGAPVTSTGTVTEKAAVARKDSNGGENGENGGNGGTTPPENGGGENEE